MKKAILNIAHRIFGTEGRKLSLLGVILIALGVLSVFKIEGMDWFKASPVISAGIGLLMAKRKKAREGFNQTKSTVEKNENSIIDEYNIN